MCSPEEAQSFSHFTRLSSASWSAEGPSSTALRHSLYKLGLRQKSASLKIKNVSTGDRSNEGPKQQEGRVLTHKGMQETEARLLVADKSGAWRQSRD